jgi:ribonucleoside-diphosphate reductase alpha chain
VTASAQPASASVSPGGNVTAIGTNATFAQVGSAVRALAAQPIGAAAPSPARPADKPRAESGLAFKPAGSHKAADGRSADGRGDGAGNPPPRNAGPAKPAEGAAARTAEGRLADEHRAEADAKALEAERSAAARLRGYQGDACGECGNFTLVRNGTCLKCDTCGATTGCS